MLHHGRGANEEDLLPLAELLDPERRLQVVTPRAPFQIGGSPGYHWYLVPKVGYPDHDTFHASYARLSAFHDQLRESTGIPSERTVLGGFSAPAFVAAGDYSKVSAPKVALDDVGNASLVWSQTTRTEAATRSPGGAWSAAAVLASQSSSSVATAIDGAGNAIAVFGSSYSWHLADGSWRPAAALPSGSAGGLVVADPVGTFVYADSGGNAFTFAAGAAGFGAGSGSRGSLADLKIVPGHAVMLAAGAISAEAVS